MKKVLAWAVALALVLSSFTMAFAGQAADSSQFKDADQIQYTEAVDVMVATGVINGFPDGTFGPQKTVTRGQMAKMIAVIMNGGEDVGDQYKSACPFADSKNHWAAGYIAFCASEHIIDGRSADVFDPDADVTGTEVAKMALTSLGYDSKIQGYTGENWAAAVLKDAKSNGLFKGLKDFTPGDPCSREAAAQILFNMLKAQTVSYPFNTSVNVGDATVSVTTEPQKGAPLWYKAFDEESDKTLEPISSKSDNFGRPGHAWKVEGEDLGPYTDAPAYEFIAKDVSGEDALKAAVTAYDEEVAEELYGDDSKYDDFYTLVNGTTGQIELGDKVELYLDDYYGEVLAVVTQYRPAQITKVNTKVSKDEAAKGITAKLTLDTDAAVKSADNTMVGYDESAYVEGAVIAIAVGKEKQKDVILDSYVPEELVAGEVTKIKSGAYTIGGKDYNTSGVFKAFKGDLEVKGEYTVYAYDEYMFASVKTAAPVAEVFYGVITANKTDQGEGSGWSDETAPEPTDWVRIFNPEGQYEELALAKDATVAEGVIVDRKVVPQLISYEKDEDGAITKISTATTDGAMKDEPMKTGGVLYGKQVSEDVAAFALIPPATTDGKAEWKVYSFADLEAAKAIEVKAFFEEESGLVAMEVGSLEDAVEPDVTLAFYTKATQIKNDTGTAYDIDVFENGEAKTYTTVGTTKNQADVTVIEAYDTAFQAKNVPAELVVITFDGDLVKKVEAAKCIGKTAPVSDFTIDNAKYDAVFFGDGQLAANYNYIVRSISGNSLNVGLPTYINNQTVTDKAVVYYINEKGELEKSEFGNIEEGNRVILMQMDAKSSTWDTVFFTDQNFLPGPQNPDQA